jgi:hypothetical protein
LQMTEASCQDFRLSLGEGRGKGESCGASQPR